MSQLLTRPFLAELLIGYATLFSIINPFGLCFVFLARTQGLDNAERVVLARRVTFYSFCVLIASLFVGSQILRLFGITLPALRIAGGLVVALSGWAMLTAPDESGQAAPVHTNPTQIQNAAFFPLTIPLTTGPGSIAAAIALDANRSGSLRAIFGGALASLLIATLVAATIYFAYSRAEAFSRWAGAEGTRVITRLSAFLLMAVGVQIVLTGLSDFLPGLIARGIHMQGQP
jgi:multiple antibiotic resistance protein